MKKFGLFTFPILFILFFSAFVKADGIPVPPIRPYVKEEHQIVLVEFSDQKLKTTLDLGIRNKPSGLFPILENSIYISSSNPFWLKTFLLPSDFQVKELCFQTYSYFRGDKPTVKVTINGHVVYLHTKSPSISYEENTYCSFITNQNMSNPQFVDVSQYFIPGQYNTIEVRRNDEYRSFSIYKIYLTSGETSDTVRIVIPFKTMPTSVEVGGYGLNVWQLDNPFKERKYWYGYYGGKLLSEAEAPTLASQAELVEANVKSRVSQTEVATDVTGGFQGKVSDVLSTASLEGSSSQKGELIIKFAGESIEKVYESYMQDNAYVIELKIKPFELKRIVIKWEEDVSDLNNFDYYYPLGTGATWQENISYTAIYVKLPKPYAIKYSNVQGMEEATDNNYNYYRWKFVDSNPSEDLHIDIKKLTPLEESINNLKIWIARNSAIVGIVLVLIFLGVIIQIRHKKRRRR